MTVLRLDLYDGFFVLLKDRLYVFGDGRKRFSSLGTAPVRKPCDQNDGGKKRPARSSAHETITGQSANHRHEKCFVISWGQPSVHRSGDHRDRSTRCKV